MDSMEYKAIYKCRLCGKLFEKEYVSTGKAVGITGRLVNEDSFAKGDVFGSRYAIHNCKDYSCGFADFQGFKKIEKDV